MSVIPLFHPLEWKPVVSRAIRYLNLDLSAAQKSELGIIISKDYKSLSGQLAPITKVSEGELSVNVRCYPVDYIPRMIELINDYLKPKRTGKRPRIKKPPITNL